MSNFRPVLSESEVEADDVSPFSPAIARKRPLPKGDEVEQLANIRQSVQSIVSLLEKDTKKTETVAVSNLSELSKQFSSLEKAVKAINVTPNIDVKTPAPNVTVEAPDLSPIQSLLTELKTVLQASNLSTESSEQTNVLVDEKYDSYKIEYGGFGDEADSNPVATRYFLDGKQVAKVEFSYNDAGNLTGAKKV